MRPVRLVAQDTALSRRRHGFDSRTGRQYFQSLSAPCNFAARPETSIKLNHCPANTRKQHFYYLALRIALLVRDSLDVGVHSDFQSSVTQ
jgi:hypothetical protein